MSDDEEKGGILIPLPLPKPQTRVEPVSGDGADVIDPNDDIKIKHGGGYCGHRAKYIHPNMRSVTCQACGCQLDVFDALADWVRKRDALIYEEKERRRRITELSEDVAELTRQVRNLKAQLRRVGAKLSPPKPAREKGEVIPWPIKD